MSEPDTNPFEPTESDVEDASPTLQLLDSDRDEGQRYWSKIDGLEWIEMNIKNQIKTTK